MLITGMVIFAFIFLYAYGHRQLIDGFRPSKEEIDKQRKLDQEERQKSVRETEARIEKKKRDEEERLKKAREREAERKSKMTPEQIRKEEEEKIKRQEELSKKIKMEQEENRKKKEAQERRNAQEAAAREKEHRKEMQRQRRENIKKQCNNYGLINVENGFTPLGDLLPSGVSKWTGNPNAYCNLLLCSYDGVRKNKTAIKCATDGPSIHPDVNCQQAACPQDPNFYK